MKIKNGIVSVAKTSQFHLGHFQHFVQASSCTSVWKSSHSWPSWPTADESQIGQCLWQHQLQQKPILSPHLSGITFRSGGARGVGSHRPPVDIAEMLRMLWKSRHADMLHRTVTSKPRSALKKNKNDSNYPELAVSHPVSWGCS